MHEIELEEIKKIEIRILNQINNVCRKENINYSLCYGSLLGAVRHKGFIPWDDDIDIFMPRSDYMRFIDYCKVNETPFLFQCHELNEKYIYLYGKAIARDTVLIEKNTNPNNVEMGVFVDIFPMDYIGDSFDEAKMNFDRTKFWQKLLVAKNWKRYIPSVNGKKIKEPIRFVFFIMSRLFIASKIIAKIQKDYLKYTQGKKEYCCFIGGPYGHGELIHTSTIESYTTLSFEGNDIMCISNYDEYLKGLYRDYMKLPPEEKRVTHHTFTAYLR